MFYRLRLKMWSEMQLRMKSIYLQGRIDGLAVNRSDLQDQLHKTMDEIRGLEDLRRSVSYANEDEAAIDHLRYRERELREEIEKINLEIFQLYRELNPIEHELYGREPDLQKRMQRTQKKIDKLNRRR